MTDPIERLRAHNPVSTSEAGRAVPHRARHDLLEEIMSTPTVRREVPVERHPARRRLPIAAAVAAVVVLAVGVPLALRGSDRAQRVVDRPPVPGMASNAPTRCADFRGMSPGDATLAKATYVTLRAAGWRVVSTHNNAADEGMVDYGTGPLSGTESSSAGGVTVRFKGSAKHSLNVFWRPAKSYQGHVKEYAGSACRDIELLGQKSMLAHPGDGFYWVLRPVVGGRFLEIQAHGVDDEEFKALMSKLEPATMNQVVESLPAGYVHPEERADTAKEMLRDVPLPAGMKPADIPSIQTNPVHFELDMAHGVACGWIAASTEGQAQQARTALTSHAFLALFDDMQKRNAQGIAVEYGGEEFNYLDEIATLRSMTSSDDGVASELRRFGKRIRCG